MVVCINTTDIVRSQVLYAVYDSVSVVGRTAKAKLSTSSFASSGAITDLNAEIEHATGLERCVGCIAVFYSHLLGERWTWIERGKERIHVFLLFLFAESN